MIWLSPFWDVTSYSVISVQLVGRRISRTQQYSINVVARKFMDNPYQSPTTKSVSLKPERRPFEIVNLFGMLSLLCAVVPLVFVAGVIVAIAFGLPPPSRRVTICIWACGGISSNLAVVLGILAIARPLRISAILGIVLGILETVLVVGLFRHNL